MQTFRQTIYLQIIKIKITSSKFSHAEASRVSDLAEWIKHGAANNLEIETKKATHWTEKMKKYET